MLIAGGGLISFITPDNKTIVNILRKITETFLKFL
jgi:hypothetical protein